MNIQIGIFLSLSIITSVVEATKKEDAHAQYFRHLTDEHATYYRAVSNEKETGDQQIDLNIPIVISLGYNCQVAEQLRMNGVRKHAFPFDWNRTTLAALYAVLEDDFKDFMNPQYLAPSEGEECFITHKKYGIQFCHDFSLNDGGIATLELLNEAQFKYQKRIERFYHVLSSAKHVFLFRYRYLNVDEPLTQENVTKLRDILLKKFPTNNWTLIVIDSLDEYKHDWQMARVKNFYIHQSNQIWNTPEHTLYFDDAWKSMLKELKLIS